MGPMEEALIDMHPIAILTRYAKLEKPLVYQQKMLEVIEIIKKHGTHAAGCARRSAYEKLEPYYMVDCDCGWAEIVEMLG